MVQPATMHVKVHAPFKVYFDGVASSFSAVNDTGPFDILPHHKNFMSLLKPCNISVIAPDKPEFTMPITRGVIHVKADHLTVFLDV